MEQQPGWSPYLDDIRGAAIALEHAGDIASTGARLGRLGFACGSCHAAADARPTFSYGPPPRDVGSQDAQMERHQWAAKRLWEGVIGPSDREWTEGATVLATDTLDVSKMVHEKPNADVAEFAERLRADASRAQSLRDHGERARFYGEMMSTCAGCHQIVRPYPVALGRED